MLGLSSTSNNNDGPKEQSELIEPKPGPLKSPPRKGIFGAFDLKRSRAKSRQDDQGNLHRPQSPPPAVPLQSHESMTHDDRKTSSETGKGDAEVLARAPSYDTYGYYHPSLRLKQRNRSPVNTMGVITSDSDIRTDIGSNQPSAIGLYSTISMAQNWLDLQGNSSGEGGDSSISDSQHGIKASSANGVQKGSRRSKARSMPGRKATTAAVLSGQDGLQVKRTNSLGKTSSKMSSHSSLRTSRSRSRVFRSPPPPPIEVKEVSPPSLPNVDIKQIRHEIIDASLLPEDLSKNHQQQPCPASRASLRKSSLPADKNLTENIINNVKLKLSLGNKDRMSLPGSIMVPVQPAGQLKRSMSNVSTIYPHEDNALRSPHYPSRQRRRSTTDAASHIVQHQQDQQALKDIHNLYQLDYNTNAPPVPPVPRSSSVRAATGNKLTPKGKRNAGRQPSHGILAGENASSNDFNSSQISTDQAELSDNPENDYGGSRLPVAGRIGTAGAKLAGGRQSSTSLRKGARSLLKKMSFSSDQQRSKDLNILYTTSLINNTEEQNNGLNTVKKALLRTRRRGKTLPGSLATPPPVPSLPLPPMKVEPIQTLHIPSNDANQGQEEKPVSASLVACSGTEDSFSAASTPSALVIPETPAVGSGVTSGDDSMMSATSKNGTSNHRSSMAVSITKSVVCSPPDSDSFLLSQYNNYQRHGSISSNKPIDDRAAACASTPFQKASSSTPLSKSQSLPVVDKNNQQRGNEAHHLLLSPKLRPQASVGEGLYGNQKVNANSSLDRIPPLHANISTSLVGSLANNEYEESMEKNKVRQPHPLQEISQNLTDQHHQHRLNEKVKVPSSGDCVRREDLSRYDDGDQASLSDMETARQRSKRRTSESYARMTETSSPRERSPKSVQTILRYYSQYLSEYERREITKYEQIYFFGPHAKKVKGTPDNPILNYGYDDERGDYHLVAHDQLAYRYEILKRLGQGSFGQVVKCLDHKTGEHVAIKLIRNKRRFQGQALTEVRILKKLVEWDPDDRYHNIRMTDYFYFRDHMCIAFECLSMNLYEFIKSNSFQGFSLSLIRRFAIQILKSLCLLYEHQVIHCDLKPENILLKHPSKSTLKIIDFGSSCRENEKVYTYIQSRFYRAPEVILGITYGMQIDMWSLGCILAELYAGVPIFPGDTEQDQLGCIIEVLGVPPRHIIEQSTRRALFFDFDGRPRPFVSARGRKRKPGSKPLPHMLRGCPDVVFVDFIEKCLRWDPFQRMRPREAFHHEWIAQQLGNSSGINESNASFSSHSKRDAAPVPTNHPPSSDHHPHHPRYASKYDYLSANQNYAKKPSFI